MITSHWKWSRKKTNTCSTPHNTICQTLRSSPKSIILSQGHPKISPFPMTSHAEDTPLSRPSTRTAIPFWEHPLGAPPFQDYLYWNYPLSKTFIKRPQHTKEWLQITHHAGKTPHSVSIPRIRLNLCAPKLHVEEMSSSCVLWQCYRYHMYTCVCMYVCRQPCTNLYMSICI